MSTYDHKRVISDYANGRITAEMAVGHCLQHIDKLYEVQTGTNISRYETRSKVDILEQQLNGLQKEMARLAALIEQLRPKRQRNDSDKPSKDDP